MLVFVTGATGYVGGAVVERLIHAGHEVVALARSRERARPLAQLVARVVVADISDVESVFPAHVDAVVHTAFRLFPAAERRVNVDGSLQLIRTAAAAGVRKFVFTSSSLVLSATSLYTELARILDVAPPRRLAAGWIFAAAAITEWSYKVSGATPPFDLDIARLASFRAGSRSVDRARRLLGFEPKSPDPLPAILELYRQRGAS